MQVKKQQLELTGSKLEKKYDKAVYCNLVYLTSMLRAPHKMLGWMNHKLDESQAGIKIGGRNINNLRYADDTTLNGRKRRRIKEPLDESERAE